MSDLAVILLIEDRQDDIFLIRTALQKGQVLNPIQAVKDGEEAIAYLIGEGKFGNREEFPLPGLILLDLKMPRMDGFELLQWIRHQPGLKAIRVIVLTSSEQMDDVDRAYELGANSFLVKPLDFEQFVATAQLIREYWLCKDKAPQVLREKNQNSKLSND